MLLNYASQREMELDRTSKKGSFLHSEWTGMIVKGEGGASYSGCGLLYVVCAPKQIEGPARSNDTLLNLLLRAEWL